MASSGSAVVVVVARDVVADVGAEVVDITFADEDAVSGEVLVTSSVGKLEEMAGCVVGTTTGPVPVGTTSVATMVECVIGAA